MKMMETEGERLFLQWDNFYSNMSTSLHTLLQGEELVDVTIAVEGHVVQAHKLVLSVCSPYFRRLFSMNPCQHPIVILKDVGHKELEDILEFMYRGEVSVAQEDLAQFLKTADLLQIKGLAEDDTPPETRTQETVSEDTLAESPTSMPVTEIKASWKPDAEVVSSQPPTPQHGVKTEVVYNQAHIQPPPKKRKRDDEPQGELLCPSGTAAPQMPAADCDPLPNAEDPQPDKLTVIKPEFVKVDPDVGQVGAAFNDEFFSAEYSNSRWFRKSLGVVKVMQGNSGKLFVVHKGFLLTVLKIRKEHVYWRCKQRSMCKANISTCGNAVIRTRGSHRHPVCDRDMLEREGLLEQHSQWLNENCEDACEELDLK